MKQKGQIDDLEDRHHQVKKELESKTVQLEKLSFINKDFKEKANIGMLEFLELELKNKENQLTSTHARLDEKQKEYASKLEAYQKIFNDYTSRIKELEQENFDLRQQSPANLRDISNASDEVQRLNNELNEKETDLSSERERARKLHEEVFREKGIVMQLEIKVNELENLTLDQKMKIGDLEHKVEEYESHLEKLETFNSETDQSARLSKLFNILNSVKKDSLKINIERVEELLKSFGATFQKSAISAEEVSSLRRENADLKKNLKELKQTFLTSVPNPSEEDLKSQKTGESIPSSSSMVAQQLLKKVLIYEEQNNSLKVEKKQAMEGMMTSNRALLEQISILYSIIVEQHAI
jgi:uncharacterized protein YlxP (DUF503 family)